MGGVCSAHGGDEKCVQKFCCFAKDHSKDLSVHGSEKLKMYLREIDLEGVDWIHVA
jgi:hypothetical protein